MSCNGCRVLRKGCSESCILRSCIQWIESPQAQGNATLFLAKFFGRSDLMSLISAVPESQRPALFRSLLFEACGRTVNPVNGAVGLLSTGNWHVCQAAVETVLAGGVLEPLPGIGTLAMTPKEESSETLYRNLCMVRKLQEQSDEDHRPSDLSLTPWPKMDGGKGGKCREYTVHKRQRNTGCYNTDEMSGMTSLGNGQMTRRGRRERKLLNLFV